MAMRAAIVRWTGRGDASDLRSSVRHVLSERGIRAEVKAVGRSLVVSGVEPVRVCSIFEKMPGVAWTAAGFMAGAGEMAEASAELASRYLRRGTRFSVLADVTGGSASDLAGAVISAMLERVKGARASGASAAVRFRAAMDGAKGVVGAEASEGPGGAPMGGKTVACLISGGVHSAVLAWSALLLGFRVRMVHASSGEESIYAAARLYSEFSNRADPRGLTLTVLEGGPAGSVLSRFVSECRGPVYAGFTAGRPAPEGLDGIVRSPLFMLPEEEFEARFATLGVKGLDELTGWEDIKRGGYAERSFGGKIADVSGVLDGLG